MESPIIKGKMKITEAQLRAIIEAADTLSAMVGVGEDAFDTCAVRIVKAIDRFLKSNGIKRKYN